MPSLVEVVYLDKGNQPQRQVFPSRWLARSVVAKLIEQGFRAVKARKVRTDIWLCDTDGDAYLVASGVEAKAAAKWAYEMAGVDRELGVLLWPTGAPLHESFRAQSEPLFANASIERLDCDSPSIGGVE